MSAMEMFWKDVRFGFRTLRKSPGFTAIAVIVLALGIGANTAIFSVADAFLLKPVNLPDISHLVVMLEQPPGERYGAGVSPANFLDWTQQAKSFNGTTAWMWDAVNLTGIGLPEKVQGYRVDKNFFSLCGVEPYLGRTFLPQEDQPGADNVVVLSYALWQRRFGGDPGVIGNSIHLDGRALTVIGIMPKSFQFPLATDLWIPLAYTPKYWEKRNWRALFAMGRLAPGVSANSARSEINTIEARIGEAYPASAQGWHVLLTPIRLFAIGDDAHDYTLLLLAASGFVLLIVCANVANLQFVRGASRAKEVAIRAALGGSRWRIVRQLLTESVMIAVCGGLFGALFAYWTIHAVLASMPADVSKTIAGWNSIHVDLRALVFTMGVSVFAGVLAGMLPAVGNTRVQLGDTLKEGGRSGSSGRGRHRLRNSLVVTQVALAVVLLTVTGLSARGFRQVQRANRDYHPESLLTMVLNLPTARYGQPAQRVEFFDQVLSRLSSLPGVTGAATATFLPYIIANTNQDFSIEGRPWSSAAEARSANTEIISPNYFRLMGIPLIRGREFADQDAAGGPDVVVISQTLARHYWPNQDPIGHRIRPGHIDPWATIVGVVGDVTMNWSDPYPPYALYRPYRQVSYTYASMIVRSTMNPESLGPAVRSAVSAVDPDQPLYDVRSMSQVIRESTISITYVSVMMMALGVLALILAGSGVYGVLAFTVTQSTHEIGLRMALGALPGDVLRLIVGRGMLLAGFGLLAGIPVAYWLSRSLGAGYISGISTAGPVIFIEIALVVLSAALAASWFPARRATRTEPMAALRYE